MDVILNNLGTDAAHSVQIEASALGAKTTEKGPDRFAPQSSRLKPNSTFPLR